MVHLRYNGHICPTELNPSIKETWKNGNTKVEIINSQTCDICGQFWVVTK